MNEQLEAVIVGPVDAKYSVIWLHGLGADGHDFEPIVPELNFANRDRTRFIFPHAPHRPVTINNGYVMRAWFDIAEISRDAPDDEEGIRISAQQLSKLIEKEQQAGVACEHIVLAGFSQGGAVALHTGLRYPQRLAGIMALSTFLPLAGSLELEASQVNREIPVFMAHGEMDMVVPFMLAQLSEEQLTHQGYPVEWHHYAMEHAVIPQEIDDISHWLDRILN